VVNEIRFFSAHLEMIENRMQIIAASTSRPAPSTTVSAM
jgi:hypothetical protein